MIVLLLSAAFIAYLLFACEPTKFLHRHWMNRICRPCVAFWLALPTCLMGLVEPALWFSPFLVGALSTWWYKIMKA